METTKPFPLALRELILDTEYVTRTGKPNWAAFAAELDGFHYEKLRRAANGQRPPSRELIEECARALRVRPEYFMEYRIHRVQRQFDPSAVGRERALRNLELWAALETDTDRG